MSFSYMFYYSVLYNKPFDPLGGFESHAGLREGGNGMYTLEMLWG